MKAWQVRDLNLCRLLWLAGAYLYYHEDESPIPDEQWTAIGTVIEKYQQENKQETYTGFYDEVFNSPDWSPYTAFDISDDDPHIITLARMVADMDFWVPYNGKSLFLRSNQLNVFIEAGVL